MGDDLMVRIESDMYDELMLATNGLFNASIIENQHITSFVDDGAEPL